MFTYNMDILSLHKKHLRFKLEVEKSQSANLADIKEFDLKRFESYITDLETKKAQIVAQPEWDLPEWSPNEYPLEDFGPVADVENELIADFLHYLEALDFELINSQSSRHSTSLTSHDLLRYEAGIQKLKDQVAYALNVSPIDRPESAPRVPAQGRGNTGV